MVNGSLIATHKMVLETSDVFFRKSKEGLRKIIGYQEGYEINKKSYDGRNDVYSISGKKEIYGFFVPERGFYDPFANKFYYLEEIKDAQITEGFYELVIDVNEVNNTIKKMIKGK